MTPTPPPSPAIQRLLFIADAAGEVFVLTPTLPGPVIADVVPDFDPDHIVLALRSATHRNRQEHRLVEHIKDRFRLPLTTYAVAADGHTPAAARLRHRTGPKAEPVAGDARAGTR
jgi:hypothetical protein